MQHEGSHLGDGLVDKLFATQHEVLNSDLQHPLKILAW